MLVVEVDGGYHSEPRQETDDIVRTAWLEKMGYDVIRFTNDAVMSNLDDVLEQLYDKLK